MAGIFDLRFQCEVMADFVVLSTGSIPMYYRILHFSPQCFVTLEVLNRCI